MASCAISAITGIGRSPQPTVDEDRPKQSPSRASMGSMETFTGSISQMSSMLTNPIGSSKKQTPAEPKKDQAPEKQSVAMAGEEPTPQVTSSETAPSQETQDDSSNPQQGQGESSSPSQAAPAETSASSAQEAQGSSPSGQQGPKEKTVQPPSSVSKSLLQTMSRRRKPIAKPPQESEEEKKHVKKEKG